MEIFQLRYAVTVAKTGNFTRASEVCNISQPSLSQQIINLEAELGHKLFHRLGRRVIPTEAGNVFLERAKKILTDAENAIKEIRDDPSLGRQITVGATPTILPYLIPQLIAQARIEHPNLIIHTREEFRDDIISGVSNGSLDLGILSLPISAAHLSVELLFSEALQLVVNRDHPLAQKRDVKATDLANETFILLGNSSVLTSQIHRFCGDHNFEPRIGHQCSQLITVKSLVAMGLGISILPVVVKSPDDRAKLVYRELSGRSPRREIALIRHLQRYQSRGAEQFITLLKKTIPAISWRPPS